MKAKLRKLLSKPFVLLILLMAVIIGIDQLLIQFHVYYAANRPLYDDALNFEAALNGLWYELWFAETIAVILLPLILWLLKRKMALKTKLLPWYVAAFVMFIGVMSTGVKIYNDYKDDGFLHQQPDYISIIVHQGAYYQPTYDQFDPSLQSMLPTILKGQILVAAGYGAGVGGLWIYGSKKIKKQQKS